MMHFQGFKRPFPSNKEDFDGGAKYHIPANTPYIRYFGAAVLQFQLHDALCEAAGHKGPLHECSIYNNQAAGDQFLKLLQLGRSKKWQEALAIGTNGKYKTLDGSAILKYFAPLQQWLKEQNKGEKCGWKKAF